MRVYVCVFMCLSAADIMEKSTHFHLTTRRLKLRAKSARQRDFRREKRERDDKSEFVRRSIRAVPFLNESRRRASLKGGRTNPNRHHLGKGNEKQFR